jgi:DNA ligase (NAD+)
MQIEIPKTCPCCDYPLEFVNDQLFCRNTGCPAQLNKKLEHFAKTLGIKGLGAKTIEKLQVADLTELFYLDRDEVVRKLNSEKIADKLLSEIENSKTTGLETLLASFSIPLVGNTAATKLCKVVSSVDEITYETCKQAGLGDKVTSNLLMWLESEFVEMKAFLPFSFKSTNSVKISTNAKTICITGKLSSFKTKAEAHRALEGAGYSPVDSVTKTTDYLVDETNKGSTKRSKAESLGIEIITNLKQFLEN